MQEFTPIKEGKVREVYDNGDSLIIVATDRISAFDHILKNKITKKGAILTQMRISLLNRVLKYWRRSILEKVKSMLPKSRKQPLLYIRNVQNTH